MSMDIKGYVISVIAVSVVGAMVSALAPEGEGGGLAKNLRLACGAVMIAACISPMSELIAFLGGLDLDDITIENERAEEYEDIFYDGVVQSEKEGVEDGIIALLKREFGIDKSECRVDATLSANSDGTRIKRIFITLYGSAIWSDTGAIEKYFGELLNCEIVTAIG